MLRPPKIASSRKAKLTSEGLLCNFPHHPCSQNHLEGYEYCIRHILEDKSAPYKQCNYIYTANGRRCTYAAPKVDKRDGFCVDHTRKAQSLRQRAARRKQPSRMPETLLVELGHYAQDFETKARDINIHAGGAGDEPVDDNVARPINPFGDIDPYKINSSASKVLDYASDSDSDVETAVLDGAWKGDGESDGESVDSEQEDPLKHAGIYTAEEVALVTRDKLIRLQSLYIEQFRRLQHVLREKRRKYLHTIKQEKESLSINKQPQDIPEEQKLLEKLKALNRYHRKSGIEAVLHKKARDRRAQVTDGPSLRPPPTARCIFTEGGVRCGERTLPLARYCRKHVLEDSHQVLFRPCGCCKSDVPCKEPVPNIFEDSSCVYHISLPAVHNLLKLKVEEVVPNCQNVNSVGLDINSSAELLAVTETPEAEVHMADIAGEADCGSRDVDCSDEKKGLVDSSLCDMEVSNLESVNSEASTDTASMDDPVCALKDSHSLDD